MTSSVRLGVFGLALVWTAAAAAAPFVVILRSGGSWQVLEAEKITVNGKDKVRSGVLKKLELTPDDYKRLQDQPLASAGVLRAHASGYLVRKLSGDWVPVAPDGANPKGPSSYAALWQSAAVVVQRTKDSKSAGAIRVGDLFAVLPEATRDEGVTAFLEDEHNFLGVGERDENAAFQERMSLLVGVAQQVGGDSAAKLKQLLMGPMDSINQQLGAGIAHYSDLQRGLAYASVSDRAYPNDDAQKRARAALREKLAWLEQRVAILKAFGAGEEWDAFLDKYGDFERWDGAFDDLHKLRDKAFVESTSEHKTEGQRLIEAKQYTQALRELKLAQQRSPADPALSALIENVAILEAHDTAGAVKPRAVDLASPTQQLITRHLSNSETYISTNRLKEASDELAAAEALDPGAARIMIVRAEWLRGDKEMQKALDELDAYFRKVSSPEDIAQGERLRSAISIELKTTKENLKAAIQKAEADYDYVAAMRNAEDGVKFDAQDLDFLLHAGINGVVLRRTADAQKWLNQYLQLSSGPGSDPKVRQQVYNILALPQAKPPAESGTPNWFSGFKSPAGVFYCPQSLAPNARITEVKGARGLSVAFEWNKDVLAKVTSTGQNAKGGITSTSVYFDYFKDQKAVRRVGAEPFAPAEDPGTPRFTPSGPAGAGKGAYVVLPNHPVVDPLMIQRLISKPVATIVAGNPYFNPFVWDGVYSFLAEYDDQGRVKSARQINVEQGQTPHEFDFKWDGLKLTEIAERGGSGYRRTMAYANNKLVGEAIAFQGKVSKIEYKYQGDQLVEASSGDDPSIDGRSRHVVFR